MSSRHRVKAVAVDDDFLDDDDYGDDYDEAEADGDGLTDYDKEQLRLGTIEVRKQLGPDYTVTDAEIQESLWHYYYDIGKSVTYLKSKKSPSFHWEFEDRFAHGIQDKKKAPQNKSKPNFSALPTFDRGLGRLRQTSPKFDFFEDCPWLQVPVHRRAFIRPLPLPYKGGLLGGSSSETKMSKLAALAAKRRQKENEKATPATTHRNSSPEPGSYVASLEKLRINPTLPKTSKPPTKEAPDDTDTKPRDAKRKRSSTVEADPGNEKADTATTKHPLALDLRLDSLPSAAVVSNAEPSSFASILTATDQSGVPTASDRLLNTANGLSFYNNFIESNTKTFDFTDPSPDDIVVNAQKSKGNKAAKAPAKANSASKQQDGLAQDMNKLAVSQAQTSKSKGLDVLAEYRKQVRKPAANFVVIGHVDAGKSTLMGRLLYDLKAIDQRTIDKYKREAEKIGKGSFAFAWVLDQGSEERARGVTIDIATNKFETQKTAFTILDAPGHQDFVPNMIAGASQADFAVLVIDASTGNFESGLRGQTKEHALLVRSMGVQRAIVAVNKMDMVEWSQERFDEIRQQMSAFLTTAGFQEQNLAFVPCSGLQGDNILRKTDDSKASWYTGSTLVEELDKSEPITHAIDKALRLSIVDVFRGGVQNPLSVSGRIDAGSLQVGDIIKIMPSGEKANIRGVEVDEEPVDWAVAGQNVIIHLADIDPIHIRTGDVLCSQADPIQNIQSFNAKLLAFEHLTPMHLDVHKGRIHVPGRITQLIATLDKSTGAVIKKKPRVIQPGSLVRVRVELDQAMPLESPARIILRSQGETVAAGLLED